MQSPTLNAPASPVPPLTIKLVLTEIQQALASAVEWAQGVRSTAAAASSICTQYSACAAASSHGPCNLNAAMCQQLCAIYLTLVDNMRVRLGEHSAILRPLLVCQQNFNALARSHCMSLSPSPFPLPVMHSLSLAVQSMRDAITLYNSCLLQLLARPTPPPSSITESASDPVLQALGGDWLLAQLHSARRAAGDAAVM